MGILSFAQAPDTLWTRTYGGNLDDIGYSVQQTTDGGYIISGYTQSFGSGGYDVYVIKTNANGDTIWTKTYGGSYIDVGNSVKQTTDGGYIVTGLTDAGYGDDVWLIKTNSIGDTLWTKTYGGTSSPDQGFAVQQTNDGGYIITGLTMSYGAGGSDVYLIKTNSSGDTLWTKTYGGVDFDAGNSVVQTTDDGYIITGYTYSYGIGQEDVWLLKTDSLGDTLWTRTYGGTYDDWGSCVVQTIDNGYIITGGVDHNVPPYDGYVYLIKTDAFGDTLWTKTFIDQFYSWGNSVVETYDGGYIITGYGLYDLRVIRTDSTGEALWTKVFDGGYGYSVIQTTDSCYVIAGGIFLASHNDIWLVKMGSDMRIEENPEINGMNVCQYRTTILTGHLPMSEDKSYKIFDITGRQIHTLDPAPGIYFIEVDGEIRQKVVKVR
jgi:hypothetical protein